MATARLALASRQDRGRAVRPPGLGISSRRPSVPLGFSVTRTTRRIAQLLHISRTRWVARIRMAVMPMATDLVATPSTVMVDRAMAAAVGNLGRRAFTSKQAVSSHRWSRRSNAEPTNGQHESGT